jgi:hypothetical protein
MEFDGVPGPMIGGERVVGINATISAAFVEISKELLALAQPGSDIDAVGATHNKISRDRDITAADYLGNLAIVGNVSGSSEYVICVIKNALSDGKLEISMADKDESAPKLTFKAHYDISDLNTEPWAIYYPIVGSASASSSSSASAS